jgi:hypothetical protein
MLLALGIDLAVLGQEKIGHHAFLVLLRAIANRRGRLNLL